MDTIIRGTVAGLIASALHLGFGWLAYIFGAVPYLAIHYNAVFITPPGTPLATLPMFLGTVTFFITAIFTGIVIAYIIKFSSPSLGWFKGVSVALLLYPIHSKIIPAIDPEIFAVYPLPMVLATLILTTIYGLAAGLILQYWLRSETV